MFYVRLLPIDIAMFERRKIITTILVYAIPMDSKSDCVYSDIQTIQNPDSDSSYSNNSHYKCIVFLGSDRIILVTLTWLLKYLLLRVIIIKHDPSATISVT